MADNFNFKRYLTENRLGAYSKATKLNENLAYDQAISVAENLLQQGMDAEQVAMQIEDQFPGLDVESVMQNAQGGSMSTDSDLPFGSMYEDVLELDKDGAEVGLFQEGKITDKYPGPQAEALHNTIAALQADVKSKQKLTNAILSFAEELQGGNMMEGKK